MLPTHEQRKIIELVKNMPKGSILKINACAGSGKTFTLKQIALENKEKNFLYLAFNKKIVDEIKNKFPKNVDIKTIHSLAFSFIKKRFKNINIIDTYRIFDIEPFYKNKNSHFLCLLINNFNEFLKINDIDMLNTDEDIKFIWDLIINQKLPISHNFYLKYFSLMQENELNKYDFILLDEAQDTNEVMLNVFLNNNCSKILVGDTFQNIYGFNKTINALEILDTNYECNLSISFRSTQNILNYANYFLKKYSNKNILDMKSSIIFKDDLILENKAYISRTNAEIIKFISELMKSKQDLNNYCLLKNPKDIFSLLFDIISCLAGNYDFISKQNSFLKKFNSLLEIKKYAENILDNELKNALNLLNKNYDFKAIYKVATKLYYNKNAKNFIINAHLSKGLEWDCVVLLNDFIGLSEKYHSIKKEKNMIKKENLKKYLEQELNLFYVAITRAKFKITDMSKNAPEC